jgi:tRNA (guanine37-N1)-methyltransferase
VTNIRDFATDAYRSVDDAPYGGGAGMVLMCPPVFDAVETVRTRHGEPGKVVLLTPQGRRLDQAMVQALAAEPRLILLAGHYEGFDERIRTGLADVEVSLGDFVLSGGEVAAMAVVDAVVRLLPGALGEEASLHEESFSAGLLEYPQYTRPREFRGLAVPDVLLSGDHARITAWRTQQAELRTMQRRPDLWNAYARRAAQGPPAPGGPADARRR